MCPGEGGGKRRGRRPAIAGRWHKRVTGAPACGRDWRQAAGRGRPAPERKAKKKKKKKNAILSLALTTPTPPSHPPLSLTVRASAAPAPDAAPPPSRRAALTSLTLALTAALAVRPAGAEEAEGAVADAAAVAKATPAPAPPPPPPPAPPAAASFARLADPTLSYAFDYPTSVGGTPLPLLLSRRPERYSSAAPLSADARQRIVCELIALAQGVTVSVTVGPAAGVLKGRDPGTWTPKEVAATVLADRSTARVTGGQRVSLNAIERATKSARGPGAGGDFYAYEHLSQGSPSERSYDGARETYRHAWAVTGVRAGERGDPFLYTLNLSCPQDLWPRLGPAFEAAAASFELPPPGKGYVPPDSQPWRFF